MNSLDQFESTIKERYNNERITYPEGEYELFLARHQKDRSFKYYIPVLILLLLIIMIAISYNHSKTTENHSTQIENSPSQPMMNETTILTPEANQQSEESRMDRMILSPVTEIKTLKINFLASIRSLEDQLLKTREGLQLQHYESTETDETLTDTINIFW